jgi:hypothetical protein
MRPIPNAHRKIIATNPYFKDNYGFKPRTRNCVICGNQFIINNQLRLNRKTCSDECHYKLKIEITKKNHEKIVEHNCKQCEVIFFSKQHLYRKFCSMNCQIKYLQENRRGKNNPGYRNGLRTNGMGATKIHMAACRKNRREFLKENDYLFCELCGTNQSLRFESHHIVFASEAPNHKELHNKKNLIMLCIQCHNDLHIKKYLRNSLVIKRGLNKLFGRNLLRYPKKLGIKD